MALWGTCHVSGIGCLRDTLTIFLFFIGVGVGVGVGASALHKSFSFCHRRLAATLRLCLDFVT
jgi:hypothetical protein